MKCNNCGETATRIKLTESAIKSLSEKLGATQCSNLLSSFNLIKPLFHCESCDEYFEGEIELKSAVKRKRRF